MEILAVLIGLGIIGYLIYASETQAQPFPAGDGGLGGSPLPQPGSTTAGSSTVWGGGGIGSIGVLDNPDVFTTTYKGVPATFSMSFTNPDLGGYTIGDLLSAGYTPAQVTNLLNGGVLMSPIMSPASSDWGG